MLSQSMILPLAFSENISVLHQFTNFWPPEILKNLKNVTFFATLTRILRYLGRAFTSFNQALRGVQHDKIGLMTAIIVGLRVPPFV